MDVVAAEYLPFESDDVNDGLRAEELVAVWWMQVLKPFLQSRVSTLLDSFQRRIGSDTKQHRGVGEASSTSNHKCRRL